MARCVIAAILVHCDMLTSVWNAKSLDRQSEHGELVKKLLIWSEHG